MNHNSLKNDAIFYASLFMIFEALIVYLGFLASHDYHYASEDMLPEVKLVTLVSVGLFHLVYSRMGMYNSTRGMRMLSEFQRVLSCWLLIVAGAGLFAFVTKFGFIISRLWFGTAVLTSLLLVSIFRLSVRLVLIRARRKGLNFRTVVLVGAVRDCERVVAQLKDNSWAGLMPIAVFDDSAAAKASQVIGVPVLGRTIDVYDFVETQRRLNCPVDQIWMLPNDKHESAMSNLLAQMEDSSVDIRLVPDFMGIPLTCDMIDEVAGIPIVNLSKVRKEQVGRAVKTVFDLVVTLAVLVLAGPLMILIGLLIKFDTPGPVFFRQRRYGIDGKEILVWKFRTMSTIEIDSTVRQVTRNDSRTTRVGRVLRRTSLDELPQFINVLSGDMSVIGPRPHAVSHNELYRSKIRGYMSRHKIKPGITGWAQVNGWRGETDTLEKMENRVRHDIEYICNWSLMLDLKILMMTLQSGFINKNAY